MQNFITSTLTWFLENVWFFVEEFLKLLVDGIAFVLPATPTNFQLGSLVTGYVEANDFMSYFIIQIVQGFLGIFAIIIIYKFIKILPLV